MSAFRQAVLSVAPERLEQFSMEMKKNINEKQPMKRKKSHSRKKSSSDHSKKRQKSSSHEAKTKSSSVKDKKTGPTEKITEGKSDTKAASLKQKREVSMKKKIEKKKHTKDATKDDSDVDPKDLDLSVPLCSLTELVKKRTELLDTVFTIIKGPKLTSMLPNTLKLMPLDEIKRLCHEQLDGMSSKRVIHILSGTNIDFSSGTDSSDAAESASPAQTSAHDNSLQTNFIDSTTEEPATTSKSMLFPSAVSTAHSKISSSEILPKKVVNNSVVQQPDAVSTSTEPNFIYTAEVESGPGEESEETSDPEEGEVDSSGEEDKPGPPKVHKEQEIEEEVLVEEVEMEDCEEEDTRAEQAPEASKIPPKPCRSREGKHPEEEETRAEQAPEAGKIPPKPRRSREGKHPEEERIKKELIRTEESMKKAGRYSGGEQSAGTSSGTAGTSEGKSQLEILELELRARAIRSLMKAAQSGKLKRTEK